MQKVKEVYTCLGFSDGPATEDPTQAEQTMSLLKDFTDHGLFFPLNFPLNNDFLHHFAKEVGVQYTSWQILSRMTFLNHWEQYTDI